MPDDAIFIEKNMVPLFIHDLETTENDSVTFEKYFGVSDNELNKDFYSFQEEYEVIEKDSTDNFG